MASSSSLYEVLGLPTSASSGEIKLAYRRLARVRHPDVVAVSRRESSADEFKVLHAAYSTLSDPTKRANYDRDLFLRRWSYDCSSSAIKSATMAAASSAVSGFSGYGRKNWETDQCW